MNNFMQEQINKLQKQVDILTKELALANAKSSRNNFSNEYVFTQPVTFRAGFSFTDGANIPLGTGTGTKIGTGSTQKVGFLGATPVARQAGISSPSGGATIDSQARAAIDSIRAVLTSFGFTS